MAEEYKISLGVAIDTSDLKTEINKLDGKEKVKLGVDLKVNDIRDRITAYNKNSNNAKLKLGIKLDTSDIKRQISKLNLGDAQTGKGVAIPVDTKSLETSLNEVKVIISSIQSTIGGIGDGSEMQPLLSSVNQIANALGKVENETQSVISALNALSKKDFNINFGINAGGSNNPIARNAAYGNKVRSETLPQLKRQAESLVSYVNDYYKTSYNELEALQKLVHGTKLGTGDFYQSFLFGEDSVASRMSSGSLAGQMQAFKQYIDMFKQAASLKGINLESVTSQFSMSADDLIKDAQDIQTGAKEAKDSFEQLKGIFGASIDGESLSAQLTPIVDKLEEIRVAVGNLSNAESLGGLSASFDKLSSTLETLLSNAKQVQEVLGASGSNANAGMSNVAKQAQETANAYKEVSAEANKIDNISIDIADGNIDELKSALKTLKVDDSSIENVTNELSELGIIAKSVSTTFKDGNLIKWEIKGVETTADGLERIVTITNSLGKDGGWTNLTKYSQSLDEIAVAAEKVNKKLKGSDGNTSFDVEIKGVESDFNNLSNKSEDLRKKIELLKQEFSNMQIASANGDIESLVSSYKIYESVLEDVHNQLKLNKQAEKDYNAAQKLKDDKASLKLDMVNWLKKNTRAAKEYGDEINRLISSLDKLDDAGVKGVRRQFSNYKKAADSQGLTGLSLFDQIKDKFREYSAYFSVAELFMYAEQGLRDMFEQVKLIDSAMTELKKVTNETDDTYNQFLTNAASRAKAIGTTIDGLVSSTADFARLGYDFVDSQGLAEVANIYAVVGDDIDSVETATQSLISTMAAFKDEMNDMDNSDFAMSIIDKLNEVANNYSISSGGLGEALTRSASSLSAANNTIDESISLITAANEVVQNPEKVGKWLCRLKKWLYRLNS